MFDQIVQLITVILIFLFVLVLAYLAARLTAGVQKGRMSNTDIEVLETFRIAQNKYIQVVRVGEKYYSYIVCKDTVTLLGEMKKDEIPSIDKIPKKSAIGPSFKEVFDRLKGNSKDNGNNG
jgi:flagellar protein FliO/FliZ